MDPTTAREKTSALRKALAVVEFLLADETPQSLSVIARHLGVPRQTAHRIVRQLADEGLIRREPPRDHYSLGPRMIRLSLATLRFSWAAGPMHAVLRELVDEAGETCNLGVLDHDRVIYLDRVECAWPIQIQVRVGDRLPIHATAVGKLLLAHLPTRSRQRLMAALPLTRYTPSTITSAEALAAALGGIRKQGFAMNDQENTEGLLAVAVPIRDTAGAVVAGLALHAPTARISVERAHELVPVLKAGAKKMDRQLALLAEDR